MKSLTVKTKSSYNLIIENDSLNKLDIYLKNTDSLLNANKSVIITDDNVGPIYSKVVKDKLKSMGLSVYIFTIKAGEKSKTLSTVEKIYHFLAQSLITRNDFIVALGGGVVGDIAGFVSATYLRGIKFIQLPTSLLAQIDSSVGGKTGVDISEGKNLVGAFWQPSLVVIDPLVLNTLSNKYFSDGLAEAVKYGCIKSDKLFYRLLNENAKDFLEELIFECVKIKSDIVSLDEFEHSNRMLLNFGHTIGHALEKLYNFSGLSHGEAVAIGMVIVTSASEKRNLTKKGTTELICKVLKKYSLPISDDLPLYEVANAALSDKKAVGNDINLILIESIGRSFIKKISKNNLYKFIE